MSIVRVKLEDIPPISEERKKELDKLFDRPDSEIDLSDIPELTKEWFESATLVMPGEWEAKKVVGLRLERDVIDWFRSQGKGHTTRMAQVLKSYYQHHKKPPAKS